jgi:hypothetical protein
LKVLIYALGGGWGHLTRAVALARALGSSAQVRVLANSPYISIVRKAMPELLIDPVRTREEAVLAIQARTDVLVVDTFPRGLGGELATVLPGLAATKVLIHRVINPDYAAKVGLGAFVAENYDCIFCPGERGVLSDLPQAFFTTPWLVRQPVHVDTDGVQVVVCAAGNAEEMPWYGEAAALLSRIVRVRCIAPDLPPGCPPEIWVRYWPLIDWIASARAVIGGAGYNTVNECVALAVPLIARPWPRKYDDQRRRAGQHAGIKVVRTPLEACDAARVALSGPLAERPPFRNGATDAAAWILARNPS